jgi:hypothetical protein
MGLDHCLKLDRARLAKMSGVVDFAVDEGVAG